MKKLLIDVERTRHPKSGLGYFCACLEEGLRAHYRDRSDRELTYFRARHPGEVDVAPRYSIQRLFNPLPLGRDMVHVTHQLQRYFPQRWAVPRVLTLHDLNYLHEPLTPSQLARRHRCASRNIAQADVIICISDFVRQDLLANRDRFTFRPGVKIEVVHNGIRLPDLSVLATQPTEGILPANPYLLALGVLFEKKQQHLLIDMMRFIPEGLDLVIVFSDADTNYEAHIKGLIERYQLAGRVHLYRAVSAEAKNLLLYHCEALLQPSIAEGFGLPVVEAMAMGRPLFLRPATSLPEVGGDVAFYFDDVRPEAMAELVLTGLRAHSTERQRREKLLERARQFEYHTMARGYAAAYEELLNR